VARHLDILLVDETPYFRELGALFLARSGQVRAVPDAKCAFEAVEAAIPDLVIADLDARGDGDQRLLTQLRELPQLAQKPFIALIGDHSAEAHALATRAGATDVLTKPLSRSALLESVGRLARQDGPVGRPRAPLREPVRIRLDAGDCWGTLRNVSRSGVFVDAPGVFAQEIAAQGELEIDFRLPGTQQLFSPTAEVVWRQPLDADTAASENAENPSAHVGLGMRFLALDADSLHELDDFVHEFAAPNING